MDDAELADRDVRLAGEPGGKASHVVNVRLHGSLGELPELRYIALGIPADSED